MEGPLTWNVVVPAVLPVLPPSSYATALLNLKVMWRPDVPLRGNSRALTPGIQKPNAAIVWNGQIFSSHFVMLSTLKNLSRQVGMFAVDKLNTFPMYFQENV